MNKDQQREYLIAAYNLATHSPDPSTQNAVLLVKDDFYVIASAINCFPVGVKYLADRWERPAKYQWIEHAERNAIYQSGRIGVATEGLTMVAVWAACADCARGIVQSGVSTLIRHNPPNSDEGADRWLASIEIGDTIMREGGVEIIDFTDPIPEAPAILRDGKVWQP